MTEADPAAALAQQVEDLRVSVARCEQAVRAWDARLERDGIGGTLMLRLELKQLRERLEKAIARNQATPPPAPWWCTGETEGRQMLAGLREWVEGFLRPHYPGHTARLAPCWPDHPEAVWELSTLRAEWQRIYGDPDNRDLQGALVWHDRWFPGVLSRLSASIRCDQAGCRMAARSPPRLH